MRKFSLENSIKEIALGDIWFPGNHQEVKRQVFFSVRTTVMLRLLCKLSMYRALGTTYTHFI